MVEGADGKGGDQDHQKIEGVVSGQVRNRRRILPERET